VPDWWKPHSTSVDLNTSALWLSVRSPGPACESVATDEFRFDAIVMYPAGNRMMANVCVTGSSKIACFMAALRSPDVGLSVRARELGAQLERWRAPMTQRPDPLLARHLIAV
jgi:hypothetical protein